MEPLLLDSFCPIFTSPPVAFKVSDMDLAQSFLILHGANSDIKFSFMQNSTASTTPVVTSVKHGMHKPIVDVDLKSHFWMTASCATIARPAWGRVITRANGPLLPNPAAADGSMFDLPVSVFAHSD